MLRTAMALCALSLLAHSAKADEARLLRFPTIHGKQVVFTYAGNLYTVDSAGGVARRLTSHDGFEMFPRLSHDGKQLAFTGQYDGNTEVYVMPSGGGVPKRLTVTATLSRDDVSDRMGPNNIVMGWKHDSKTIVFRSRMRTFNDFLGQLYTITTDGGLPEQIPLPHGGFCSYSPDDSKLAFNRVFREFRTWKRYRGGMADDIWVYDFKSQKTEQLTNTPDQEIIPMWHGDRIYFVADRDAKKRMNLYSIDLKTKETKQHTEFTDFDVKFASLGDQAIVFENGGYLYRFDLAADKAVKIPVEILDDQSTARGGYKDVSKSVVNATVGPDGKRALFTARGEIFSVPLKNGPTRNLSNSPSSHERDSQWSPDGKWVAWISDKTGEDEIWVTTPDGKGTARQVTKNGDVYKYSFIWSPDSKKMAWTDRKQRLNVVDVADGKIATIVSSPVSEIRSFAWSPDSKWLSYTKPEESGMSRIYLHSLDENKAFPVTDSWYASGQPSFSADGKFLFFVSSRDFNPTYSQTEWNHAYVDMSRVYMVPLSKESESPFKPRSDEVGDEDKPADEKKPDGDKKPEPPPIKVDADGIGGRILGLPVVAANYRNIASAGSVVYYVRQGSKDATPQLQMYDLKERKETNLGLFPGFELSANRKKMLLVKDGKYAIIDLPKAEVKLTEFLDLSGITVNLDRQAEWAQIFRECWRQMRDYFYDPGMHGNDWAAIRANYEPLVAHVRHRADLTYIIGEMIAELNIGHAYVGGGDLMEPAKIPLGLLGAEFARDPAGYKITAILPGANWDKKLRSPLTEIGVNAKVGDVITSIGGKPAESLNNIYDALIGTVGKPVAITLMDSDKKSHDVLVVPIGDEAPLYYHRWVEGNIAKVDKATDGKVGYIHVPDMTVEGLNEFVKHFGPQLRKKALIVDVRGNGGGNVSPMLIERLRREPMMISIARNGLPIPEPQDQLVGPKVCLLNEFSASDGDLFPWRFRQMKLGPLIGKRSWGGVVGIRGTLPLVDGGSLNRPEFSRFDLAGKEWIIEGKGVEPDIVVDNDPAKEFRGEDQQLNKGVEVILEALKTQEKNVPAVPPYPKR